MRTLLPAVACSVALWAGPVMSGDQTVLSHEEFAKLFIEHLSVKLREGDLAPGPDNSFTVIRPDGSEWHGFTDNAYHLYRQAPEDLDEVISQYVQGAIASSQLRDGEIDVARLRPCVRSTDWGGPINLDPVRTLAGELVVYLCEEHAETISYLSAEEIEELEAAGIEPLARGIENLQKLPPTPQLHAGDTLGMVTKGGNFESSLILLPEVWATLEEYYGPRLAFALPNRDMFLVAPAGDRDATDRLAEFSAESFKDNGYPLSPFLYVYAAGKIEVFANE